MCIKKKISATPNDLKANNNTSIKKPKHTDKASSRKLKKKTKSLTDSSDEAKNFLPSPTKGKPKAKNISLPNKENPKKFNKNAVRTKTLSEAKVKSAKKESAGRLAAETEAKLNCKVVGSKWNVENFKKSKKSESSCKSSVPEETAKKKRRAKLKTTTKCSMKSSTVDKTSTRRRSAQPYVTGSKDSLSHSAKQKLRTTKQTKQAVESVIAKTSKKRGVGPKHKSRLSKKLSSDDDDSVEETKNVSKFGKSKVVYSTDTEDDERYYKVTRNSVKEQFRLMRKDSYQSNKKKRQINASSEDSSDDADGEYEAFANDSSESTEYSSGHSVGVVEENNVQCCSSLATRKSIKQIRESKTVSLIEKRTTQTLGLSRYKHKRKIKYSINLDKLKPGVSKFTLTFDSDEISSKSDNDEAVENAINTYTDSDSDSDTDLRKFNALDKDNSSDVLSNNSETDDDSSDDSVSHVNIEEPGDVNLTDRYTENLEDYKSAYDSDCSSACSIPTSINKQSNKPNEFLTDLEISNEEVIDQNISDELINSPINAKMKSAEEILCSTSSKTLCDQSDNISLQDLEHKVINGFNNNAEPTVYAFKLHEEHLEEVKIGLNETIYENMLVDSIEENIVFADSTTEITNKEIFEKCNEEVDSPMRSTMQDVNEGSVNSSIEAKNNVDVQEDMSCLLRFTNNEFNLTNKNVQCLNPTNDLFGDKMSSIVDENKFEANNDYLTNEVTFINKLIQETEINLNNGANFQNSKEIPLEINTNEVTSSMEFTAQDNFDIEESPLEEIRLHWSASEDSDVEVANNNKVDSCKASIVKEDLLKSGSESFVNEGNASFVAKDFQHSNSVVLEDKHIKNAPVLHTITTESSEYKDSYAGLEIEREASQFAEIKISKHGLNLEQTTCLTKLVDEKDSQQGMAMYDSKPSVMSFSHDSTDTYRILSNEINTMQLDCVELLNENLEHTSAENFADKDGINIMLLANEAEETDISVAQIGDELGFGTVLDCSTDNTVKLVEDELLAKDTDEQEEGEILSSSSEFNDGFDEDFIGDINDRQWLNQLTERERESVIFKRIQKRENMHKRWEIRQKLQQRQNYQDYNKERSQKRKASMEKRRSNDQRSNAMAKLIEQRNDKYKRAEEECERMHQVVEEQEELPNVVCKRKPSVKLKASEIYSDDSGSSCSSSDESSSNSSGAALKIADATTDKQHGEKSMRPEAINISTVAELNQMRISRNELARIAYCPIFKQTVLNCFVRIYIGTHMGKPVHRIAEVVEIFDRVTVYKLESTISNCYLRLKHGVQNRAYPMDKISNQAFTDSEYRMWRTNCVKDNVPLPTLAQLTEKAKHLKAALHYEMTEDDISQMIEKKNKLRKWPVNVSLHKACLLKERDAAKLNGDIEHARILDKRLHEISAQESYKPMQDSCIMNFINQRSRLINMNDKHDSACPQANDPFTRRSTKPCIVATSKRRAAKETTTTTTPPIEAPPPPLPPPPPPHVSVETTQVKRPPSRKEVAERAFRALPKPKRAMVMRAASSNTPTDNGTQFFPQMTVYEPTNEPTNMKRITLADYWKKRSG